MDERIKKVINLICGYMEAHGFQISRSVDGKVRGSRTRGDDFELNTVVLAAIQSPDVVAEIHIQRILPGTFASEGPALSVHVHENGDAYYFKNDKRYGLEPMNFSIAMKL